MQRISKDIFNVKDKASERFIWEMILLWDRQRIIQDAKGDHVIAEKPIIEQIVAAYSDSLQLARTYQEIVEQVSTQAYC
jgi:hypothetical protein